MTKKLWSVNALATELDRDRRTIAAALKAVPPDGSLVGHPAWFIGTALKALRLGEPDGAALDPVQERARKDRALAIATEIKNDLASGEVVPVEMAVTAQILVAQKLRNKFLALPSRLASRVPQPVRDQVFALAEAEIHAALSELSSGDAHVSLDEIQAEIGRLANPSEIEGTAHA